MKVAEPYVYVPREPPQGEPEVVPRGGIAVPPEASPADFLRAVYTDPGVPLPLRIRAAVECAPYFHPRNIRHRQRPRPSNGKAHRGDGRAAAGAGIGASRKDETHPHGTSFQS
jgi:hypothetical protein